MFNHPIDCIVKDCKNRSDQGGFVGDLCGPCHRFITQGIGTHSQVYKNAKRVLGMKMASVELTDDFGNSYKEFIEGVADVDFGKDFVVIHMRGPDGAVSTLTAYRSDRVFSVYTYHVEGEQA